jgi:hypothetical protein
VGAVPAVEQDPLARRSVPAGQDPVDLLVAELAVGQVDDAGTGGGLQSQCQHQHHLWSRDGDHRRVDAHSGRGSGGVLGERPGVGDGGTYAARRSGLAGQRSGSCRVWRKRTVKSAWSRGRHNSSVRPHARQL